MLAIMAPSFNQPSETFIHAHVETIMPKCTVLLCEDGSGAERFQLPVLSDLDSYPTPLTSVERIWNALRYRWRVTFDQRIGGANERRARAFLQRNGVTHCLAEFGPSGCRSELFSARAGVRLFVHFHGYDATVLPRHRTWRRHYRRVFASADGIIAPSRYIADRLAALGCPRNKLHVSPCGIAPEVFPLTRRKAGQVVAVGRLVEKKAPLLTISAFVEAARNHPNAHLHMVGEGPLLDEARDLVASECWESMVTLHGAQPHDKVRALLECASLFIQHSVVAKDGDTEGLPVAILEAMASGIPVVSTRHSGIPEAVLEGKTGLLVDEHDEVGMTAAISRLLSTPDEAESMGLVGRVRAQKYFSQIIVAERLRAIMGLRASNDGSSNSQPHPPVVPNSEPG